MTMPESEQRGYDFGVLTEKVEEARRTVAAHKESVDNRARWLRRLVVSAFLANLGVVAAVAVDNSADNRRACRTAQENRDAIQAVITHAFSGSGGLRLSGTPEFEALPVEVRTYLSALEARSQSQEQADATANRRDELLALVPDLDC